MAKLFAARQRGGRKALIPFITAGDPSLAVTRRLVPALAHAGADLIELGVPFSDPMADGPVIQRADERALKQGTSLRRILRLVREVRKGNLPGGNLPKTTQIPLLLMGYYNPILRCGLKEYARAARQAGVDATLVVDLPPEEAGSLKKELRRAGVDLIFLLTPTSDTERIRQVGRQASGFVYFVSMTGVTGASLRGEEEIRAKLKEIRRQIKLPVVIGFGISTPAEAKRMAALADGVVVGSALVAHLEKARTKPAAAVRFLAPFRRALDKN